MGTKSGQASMEYLATYGMSLFALFVVIAMLASSGIFNPERFANEECTIQPNMPCKGYYIYYDKSASDLHISFNVTNALGAGVVWKGAVVNIGETSTPIAGALVTTPTLGPNMFANQGETTNFDFIINAPNFRANRQKTVKFNITFAVCEGYATDAACYNSAPEHTTSGKLESYIRVQD